MKNDVLLRTVRSLIVEGDQVVSTEFDVSQPSVYYSDGPPKVVDLESFAKWSAGCINLIRMLGDAGDQWKTQFTDRPNSAVAAKCMRGTLRAIEDAIAKGLLFRFEDLVVADAFDSLLDQADHLNSQDYYVAAGVLGRAVLEEHLRSWCQRAGCNPPKARPTMNDFNDHLLKANQITIIERRHLDSLAAVGNAAAHVKQELKRDDVSRMLREVRDFLAKHHFAV